MICREKKKTTEEIDKQEQTLRDNFQTQLGDLIAEAKAKHISQNTIADAVGISSSSLTKYKGSINPDTRPDEPGIYVVARIARYFGVSVDYLLGLSNVRTDEPDIRKACNTTGLSAEAVKALNALKVADHPEVGEVLSAIIVDKEFLHLIYRICSLRNNIATENYLMGVINGEAKKEGLEIIDHLECFETLDIVAGDKSLVDLPKSEQGLSACSAYRTVNEKKSTIEYKLSFITKNIVDSVASRLAKKKRIMQFGKMLGDIELKEKREQRETLKEKIKEVEVYENE